MIITRIRLSTELPEADQHRHEDADSLESSFLGDKTARPIQGGLFPRLPGERSNGGNKPGYCLAIAQEFLVKCLCKVLFFEAHDEGILEEEIEECDEGEPGKESVRHDADAEI